MAAFHLRPIEEKCGGAQRNGQSLRLQTLSVTHLALTPIMDTPRGPYSGTSRKLVVALDIGTTFSGAAYAFLDPGEIPVIRSVTK